MIKSRKDTRKSVKKVELKKTPPAQPVIVNTEKVDNTEVLNAINKLTKTIENKEFKTTIPKPSVIQAPIKGVEEMSSKIDRLIELAGRDREIEATILRAPNGDMHKVIFKPI